MAKNLRKTEVRELFLQKDKEINDFSKRACDALTIQLRGMKAEYLLNKWKVEVIEAVQIVHGNYRIKVRVLGPSDSEGYEFVDKFDHFVGFQQ
jgi:hypothetical protein